jgi:antitoxin VapB
MPTLQRAKVFKTGRSQAVRIPRDFRFNTDEVYIRKDPQTGDVILSPTPRSWAEIFAALDEAGVPDDFLVEREQGLPQERPEF